MVRGNPGECRECIDPPEEDNSRCDYHRRKHNADRRGEPWTEAPPRVYGSKRKRGRNSAKVIGRAATNSHATTSLRESLERLTGAACKGQDPRWWDLDVGSREELEEGKRICGLCPVQAACLEEGQRIGARGTIWGGQRLGIKSTLKESA